MDNDDRPNPTLESLLREMIANQHSIDETLRELYEKVILLEQRFEQAEVFAEDNFRADQADEPFDETEADDDDDNEPTKKTKATIHGD